MIGGTPFFFCPSAFCWWAQSRRGCDSCRATSAKVNHFPKSPSTLLYLALCCVVIHLQLKALKMMCTYQPDRSKKRVGVFRLPPGRSRPVFIGQHVLCLSQPDDGFSWETNVRPCSYSMRSTGGGQRSPFPTGCMASVDLDSPAHRPEFAFPISDASHRQGQHCCDLCNTVAIL